MTNGEFPDSTFTEESSKGDLEDPAPFASEDQTATDDAVWACSEVDELTCPVCLQLLCEPVRTPCGHAFCRVCLLRTLTSGIDGCKCPVCRRAVPFSLSEEVSEELRARVQAVDPKYADRVEEKRQYAVANGDSYPVFYVHGGARVGEIVQLRFFEPRYRLMMRRVLSTNRKFVFAERPPQPGHQAVIVNVDGFSILPDGCFSVNGKGARNVRIAATWVEEDTGGLHYCELGEEANPNICREGWTLPVFSLRGSLPRLGDVARLQISEPRYQLMLSRVIIAPASRRRFVISGRDPPRPGDTAAVVHVSSARQQACGHGSLVGKCDTLVQIDEVWSEMGEAGLHYCRCVPQINGLAADRLRWPDDAQQPRCVCAVQ
jgi:hypothetical protein